MKNDIKLLNIQYRKYGLHFTLMTRAFNTLRASLSRVVQRNHRNHFPEYTESSNHVVNVALPSFKLRTFVGSFMNEKPGKIRRKEGIQQEAICNDTC